MSNTRNKHWFWLIPVLLVLMAFGAHGLNMDMLWLDEVFSIGNVGGYQGPAYNPLQVWQSLSSNSPQHVPGYFFVLAGWAALTGWTPFGLRALALLIGLLAVAWTYRLGANWLGWRGGLYAAAALALGAFFIYFTHEVRMYTMIAFLTVFVLWIYWRIARRRHEPRLIEWAALLVGALFLLYTHLFGALVLAAVGLYHLLFVPRNRRWWIVVILLAVVGVSILPWLQVLLQGVRNVGLGEAPLPPLAIFTEMLHLFSSGNEIELALLAGVGTLSVRRWLPGAREVWFFLVVIFVLTLAANQVRPMISEGRTRYLIHLWPLLALLVALGLTTLEKLRLQKLVMPLLAVWLGFGIANTFNTGFLIEMDGPRYLKDYPPLREIVTAANNQAQSDDLLISFSRQGHVFEIFRFFTVGQFHTQNLVPQGYFATLPEARSTEEMRLDLLRTLNARLTVWLAYEPQTPPEQLAPFRAVLAEAYTLCATPVEQSDFVMERYNLTVIGCIEPDEPDVQLVHYPAGVDLRAIASGVDSQQNRLLVAAAWSVEGTIPANTYSVSFKLWNAEGEFVTQADTGLRPAGFGWQLMALPLDDVPAGDYTLTAAVYDWSSGERLTGEDSTGYSGDELLVGTVQIADS